MWDELQEKKFIVLKDFLDPETAQELGQEFQDWCVEKKVAGDKQVEACSGFYRWGKFSELQYDRIGYLNGKLGIHLFPTYNYARSHYNGAFMPRHSDRPGCEVSITCHLSGDTEWPIYFHPYGGEPIGITLTPGEAILYLGSDIDHWRGAYGGEHYNQVFLHYVDSRGPWAFCENDVVRPK